MKHQQCLVSVSPISGKQIHEPCFTPSVTCFVLTFLFQLLIDIVVKDRMLWKKELGVNQTSRWPLQSPHVSISIWAVLAMNSEEQVSVRGFQRCPNKSDGSIHCSKYKLKNENISWKKSPKVSIFYATIKPKPHLMKSNICFIISKGKARKSKKVII